MRAHHHSLPLLVAVAVGLGAYAIVHRWRHPELHPSSGTRLEGFAGWLRFLAAMQWLAVLHTFSDFALHLVSIQHQADAAPNSYWRAGLVASLAMQALLFAFVLACAVLMRRKSRLFPRLFRIELVLLAAVPLVTALLLESVARHTEMPPHLALVYWVRLALFAPAAGVGFVYSLRSVRFRNTFIR